MENHQNPGPGPGRPPENPDAGTATSHIHIRTTKNRKRAYSTAAQGGKLTEWIYEQCDPPTREALDKMLKSKGVELSNLEPDSPRAVRLAAEIQKLHEFRRALDKA